MRQSIKTLQQPFSPFFFPPILQALLSGFAIVAMVELQLPDPDAVDHRVIIAFGLVTVLLISVHLFALMVATLVLPFLDVAVEELLAELPQMEADAEFAEDTAADAAAAAASAAANVLPTTLGSTLAPASAHLQHHHAVGSTASSAMMELYNGYGSTGDLRTQSDQTAAASLLVHSPLVVPPSRSTTEIAEITSDAVSIRSESPASFASADDGTGSTKRSAAQQQQQQHTSAPQDVIERLRAEQQRAQTPPPSATALSMSSSVYRPGHKRVTVRGDATLGTSLKRSVLDAQGLSQSRASVRRAGTPSLFSLETFTGAPSTGQEVLAQVRTYESFARFIETAWIFATALGTVLFIFVLMFISHLKFEPHTPTAGWVAVGFLVFACVFFLWFAAVFYRRVVKGQTSHLQHRISDLERLNELADVVVENAAPNERSTYAPLSPAQMAHVRRRNYGGGRNLAMDIGPYSQV